VRGVAGEDGAPAAEFLRHALVHDVEVAADDVEVTPYDDARAG
jgi:hypothetical protein